MNKIALYESIKTYAKIYPQCTKLVEFSDAITVRVAGYELPEDSSRNNFRVNGGIDPLTPLQRELSDQSSIRRTKTRLSDLVICNQYDLFCTFTFRSNRSDIIACKQRMSSWLHSQRVQWGAFSYLIVPEFHADGKSLHFHALFRGYKGRLVPAINAKTGHLLYTSKTHQPLFNIRSYTHGHSSVRYIEDTSDDVGKVSSYIRKYISKDMPTFANKKRYWCSTKQVRPERIKNPLLFQYEKAQLKKLYNTKNLTYYFANSKLKLSSSF